MTDYHCKHCACISYWPKLSRIVYDTLSFAVVKYLARRTRVRVREYIRANNCDCEHNMNQTWLQRYDVSKLIIVTQKISSHETDASYLSSQLWALPNLDNTSGNDQGAHFVVTRPCFPPPRSESRHYLLLKLIHLPK